MKNSILEEYAQAIASALSNDIHPKDVSVLGVAIPLPPMEQGYDQEFIASFVRPIHQLPSISDSYATAQSIVQDTVYSGSFPALQVGDNLAAAIEHFEQCYSLEQRHNDLKAQAVRVIEKLITTENIQLKKLKAKKAKLDHALSDKPVELGAGHGQVSKDARVKASKRGDDSAKDARDRHQQASKGYLYHRARASNLAIEHRKYVDSTNNLPAANGPNGQQPKDYRAAVEFASRFFGQTLVGTSNWFEAAAAARIQTNENASVNINNTGIKSAHASGWLYMYTNVISKFGALMAVNDARATDRLAEDTWVQSQQAIYEAIVEEEATNNEIETLENLIQLLKQTYVMLGAPLDFVRRWRVISQLYQQEYRLGIERLAAAFVGVEGVYPDVAANLGNSSPHPVNLLKLPESLEASLIQAKRMEALIQARVANSRATCIRVSVSELVSSNEQQAMLDGEAFDCTIEVPNTLDVDELRITSIQLLTYAQNPMRALMELTPPKIRGGKIPSNTMLLSASHATTSAYGSADVSRAFNLSFGKIDTTQTDQHWQSTKGFKARFVGGVKREDLPYLEIVIGVRDIRGAS